MADRGLSGLASGLLGRLAPYSACLATFGQVGTVGPVALAQARLAWLLGDRVAATAHLVRALDICRRTGGAAALLHGRLEAAAWEVADAHGAPSAELRDRLAAIGHDAEQRDMPGLAARAAALR